MLLCPECPALAALCEPSFSGKFLSSHLRKKPVVKATISSQFFDYSALTRQLSEFLSRSL